VIRGVVPADEQPGTGSSALPADVAAAVEDPNIRTAGLVIEAHCRITKELDRRLRSDAGTTLQTLEVLLRVGRAPEGWIPLSQLGDTVALTSGGITRLVDRLEAEGLVERHRCDDDGRVVRLQLSPVGVDRLRSCLVAHRRHLEEVVGAGLEGVDREELEAGLDALRGGAGDLGS